MKIVIKENTKFEKIDIKTWTMNFEANDEKRIHENLKS